MAFSSFFYSRKSLSLVDSFIEETIYFVDPKFALDWTDIAWVNFNLQILTGYICILSSENSLLYLHMYSTIAMQISIVDILSFCYVWWLIWYTLRVALSIATTQRTSLSPICLVASETRQNARCRTVILSLAKHVNLYVVVRRIVAWLIYIQIANLRFELSDNVTSRQHAARHALFLEHHLRQDGKTKVRQHAVWRFVVLSLVTTRRSKVFQISHHIYVINKICSAKLNNSANVKNLTYFLHSWQRTGL
jgi:hypothetical protein